LPGVADELKAAYLLTGSDRPKVERALRRLRDRFGEDSVERLSAREASGEDAVAACNAMGLFGTGGRLVLVDEVERWKAPDATAVAGYLAAPAPGTVLALVGTELRKDSPLAKACAKAGQVLVYDVAKKGLPKWVAEQFARHGVHVTADACRLLVDLVGDNPHELAGEIDKLALWAGRDEVGEDEVEQLVAARADVPPYVLTDAWARRDVAGVLASCESILERSVRSGEIHMLVGSLVAHVRRVQTARRLEEVGVNPRDAMAALKARHPYVAQKAFEQARNFSVEELREAIVRLSGLDLAIKGGSRLPAGLELQRTLVAITRRDEPAPARAA
jgi:DNA polymerase III subunit delta